MRSEPQFPPLHVAVRENAELSWDVLEALLEKPSFSAFLDTLPDGIILVDQAGLVRICNRIGERAISLPRQQVVGHSIEEVAQKSTLMLAEFIGAGERGQSTGILRNNSDRRTYIGTRRVIRCGESDRQSLLIVLRDSHLLATSASRFEAGDTVHGFAPSEELLHSVEVRTLLDQAVRAMQRRTRLLLVGESGVGKTAVAREIHLATVGVARPFVHVNCGSIPETLFESEMFGYERGSFTGALHSGKRGYIESSAGGTLFLDEVGEIPLHSQAKLLKFLEDGTIQPVGAAGSKHIRSQLIAATNRDLAEMIENGAFRPDLYYRLKTFTVSLPPLRERSDFFELADYLLSRINTNRTPVLTLSKDCWSALRRYRFPGNVRELSNVLEHLSIVCDTEAQIADLPADMRMAPATSSHSQLADRSEQHATLKEHVRRFEDEIIRLALIQYGSKREVARRLGVDIATLVRKTRRGPSRDV